MQALFAYPEIITSWHLSYTMAKNIGCRRNECHFDG